MAAHPVTRRRPDAGFTIIEVMVAILLTALTVIGVLGLFRIETRASTFSRRGTEAAVLAQDKLEELRTFIAPAGAGTGSDNPTDQLTGTSLFTRNWTISTTADASIYRIEVVVSWDENGVARNVTVSGQRGGS